MKGITAVIYASMNNEEQKNLIKSYFDREIEAIKSLILKISMQLCKRFGQHMSVKQPYIFLETVAAQRLHPITQVISIRVSLKKKKKFNFVCLNDNYAMLMAVANDISYDEVFRFPLINKLKPTDLVIGISGSGNSKNVIRAVEYAMRLAPL